MTKGNFYNARRLGASTILAIVFISQGVYLVSQTNNVSAFFFIFFAGVMFMAWLSRECLIGEIVVADFMDDLPAIDKFLILLSNLSLIAIGFLAYVLLRMLEVVRIFAAAIPIVVTVLSFILQYALVNADLRKNGFSLKWFSSPGRLAAMLFIYGFLDFWISGFLIFFVVRIGTILTLNGDIP